MKKLNLIKGFFLCAVTSALVAMPLFAQGAVFHAGESYALDSGSSINGNLYTASSDVNISGDVSGDLMVAGGNIIMSGTVGEDVAATGGTINVMGNVYGDARILGGTVMLSNKIGGELLLAGGQINISSGFSSEKNMEIAGGTINYSGKTKGDASIKGKSVYINGTVNGNLSVKAEEIKLGPETFIAGNFTYSAKHEAEIKDGAVVLGKTDFTQIEIPARKTENKKEVLGVAFSVGIIKSIMMAVVAIVALYASKKQMKSIVETATSKFWKEAGRGFVILVVMPIAIIVCFVSIVGIPLGFIAGLLYTAFCIASAIISVLLFAQIVMKYVFKKADYKLNWWIVILSVIIFGAISIIPVVGWLFGFIIFLSAFGSTTNYVYQKLRG